MKQVNGYLRSEAYQDACEVHGEEFVDNMMEEFCDEDEETTEGIDTSYRPTWIFVMRSFLMNKFVWYVAGMLDALLVVAFMYWMLS